MHSNEAKKFHSKYWILCGFHKCLNRSWPKLINSSCDSILENSWILKERENNILKKHLNVAKPYKKETEAEAEAQTDEVWEVWMLLTTKRFINKIIKPTKRMKNLKKERKRMKRGVGTAWERNSEKPIWLIFVFNLTDTIEVVYVRRHIHIQTYVYNTWSCIS